MEMKLSIQIYMYIYVRIITQISVQKDCEKNSQSLNCNSWKGIYLVVSSAYYCPSINILSSISIFFKYILTNFVINLQTVCLLPSGLSFKKNPDIEYTFKCLAEYWRWCPGLPNRAALAFHSLVADKNKIFTNLTRRKNVV